MPAYLRTRVTELADLCAGQHSEHHDAVRCLHSYITVVIRCGINPLDCPVRTDSHRSERRVVGSILDVLQGRGSRVNRQRVPPLRYGRPPGAHLPPLELHTTDIDLLASRVQPGSRYRRIRQPTRIPQRGTRGSGGNVRRACRASGRGLLGRRSTAGIPTPRQYQHRPNNQSKPSNPMSPARQWIPQNRCHRISTGPNRLFRPRNLLSTVLSRPEPWQETSPFNGRSFGRW